MTGVIFLGVLVTLVVLGVLIRRGLAETGQVGMAAHERAELQALRILVDDLKETAWDHRELDSPLSTIIIDKIRTHERRGRGELG